jgi:hypothetical protein
MEKDFGMSEGTKKRPRPIKKRGRRPSEETERYTWYRNVEGFERCCLDPWWDGIEWEDEIKAKKAKRSTEHRETMTHTTHAGFLWETLRRLPEFPTLMTAFGRLDSEDLQGQEISTAEGWDIFRQTQNALVSFIEQKGVLVVSALRMLSKDWKLCFNSLPQESKDKWEQSYSALWNEVGEHGSVPGVPSALPAVEPLDYWG